MTKAYRAAIVVVLLVLIVFGFLNSGLVSVRELAIENQSSTCVTDEDIRSIYNHLLGKYPWQIDQTLESNKLIESHPCVKEVNFHYQFPSRLKVVTNKRSPLVRVITFSPAPMELSLKEATPSSSSALLDWSYPSSSVSGWLVDNQGVAFELNDQQNPTLFYPDEQIKRGSRLSQEVFSRLEAIFLKLGSLGLSFSQAKISDGFVQINSTPKLVVSLNGDVLYQLASLQLILAKSKIDISEIESVDLRFDKPVVVYIPKKK